MDRSLRPFSLAALAFGLVVLAAVETLEGPPAPPPLVERIEFHVTGEVLGPGVLVDDLVRTDPEPDGSLRLSGFDEDGPVGRLGLRNGDRVRCANGTLLTSFRSATSACGAPMCLAVRREESRLELCYTFDKPPIDAATREDTRREAIAAQLKARRLEREGRQRGSSDPVLPFGPVPDRRTVTRLALEPYLETDAGLQEVSKLAKISLHRGPDGELDGHRLGAIRRGTLLDDLDLRNGDVLTHLDEIPLTSEAGLGRAYEALRTRSSVCVRGLRRGASFEQCYDILP